jgi:hypothetical protein
MGNLVPHRCARIRYQPIVSWNTVGTNEVSDATRMRQQRHDLECTPGAFEAEGREFESLRARHLLLLYPSPKRDQALACSRQRVDRHRSARLFRCRRYSHLPFQASNPPAPPSPIVSGAWFQGSNGGSRRTMASGATQLSCIQNTCIEW